MQTIILNSGIGARMGDLTADRPKCLVALGHRPEESILGLQIRQLVSLGLDRLLITTGPYADRLRAHVVEHFPELAVEYVANPRHRETNYIYSLHLAREHIEDDVLLLHGDMVFERAAIESLLLGQAADAVIVDTQASPPDKDFKARLVDGVVREIGVDLRGADCVALQPIYRLSRAFFDRWIDELARFVARGDCSVYAEDALNRIVSGLRLSPVDFHGLCMEVDDVDDLRVARERVASFLEEPSS